NRLASQEHAKSAKSLSADVKEKEEIISNISIKLERLLNGYLDQVIDEVDYRSQKAKLLSEKKSLEEEISNISRKQNDWLAPFQQWLKDAQTLDKIASDSDLFAKKVCAKEIFGSHLLLHNKTLRASAPKSELKRGQNEWAALRAAHSEVGQKPLRSILVRLFYQTRTYFQNKH
ncbi:MAG: hypothetical protein ACE5HI_20910, partial [bacterium]